MPRKKRTGRKGERRKVVDRRDNAADVFWTRVFKGFEKLFESPFKEEKSKKSKKRVLHG